MELQTWGPEVRWVSHMTPRILRQLIKGATPSPTGTWGGRQNWWVSDMISDTLDFWGAIASCILSTHLFRRIIIRLSFATASRILWAVASTAKSSAQVMSVMGQLNGERRRVPFFIEGSLLAAVIRHKSSHQIVPMLLMISGGGRWPPDHEWDEVGWRVRWGWCGPAGGQGRGSWSWEWRLWRKGVETDLQLGQVS